MFRVCRLDQCRVGRALFRERVVEEQQIHCDSDVRIRHVHVEAVVLQ